MTMYTNYTVLHWAAAFANEDTDEAVLHYCINMMERDHPDTAVFHLYFSKPAIDNLYKHVQKLCGAVDAIPVSDVTRKNELEHLGKQCIIVSKTIERILAPKVGNFDDLRRTVLDMSHTEIDRVVDETILQEVVGLIEQTYSFANRGRIKICDFVNKNICGLHSNLDATIYLNVEILNDFRELLITLAHEFAHDFGDDGSKMHIDALQIILAEIIENQRRNENDPS